MIGAIPNPKKSVTLQFPFDDVKEAVKFISDMRPSYTVFNTNDVLNIYTFSATETLSLGVYIDVAVVKVDETSTRLDIEIRRKIGAFDTMAEVTNGNIHLQNVITLVSNFFAMSDTQRNELRNKYKAEMASSTREIGTTEFNCPCGQKFYVDTTKKRRAICPHCNTDRKLNLPAPSAVGGCMVVIASALGILSTVLLLLLVSITLVSCNNTGQSSEYATPTEEVTTTAETELIEPIDYSGPCETVYLSKKRIGPFICEHQAIVYLNNPKDTIFYIYVGYNNFKYNEIIDIHSSMFRIENKKSDDLKKFCDALKSAQTSIGKDVKWLEEHNTIVRTYDFTRDIYIGDFEDAYNYMTSAQANKFIEWVSAQGINK